MWSHVLLQDVFVLVLLIRLVKQMIKPKPYHDHVSRILEFIEGFVYNLIIV